MAFDSKIIFNDQFVIYLNLKKLFSSGGKKLGYKQKKIPGRTEHILPTHYGPLTNFFANGSRDYCENGIFWKIGISETTWYR